MSIEDDFLRNALDFYSKPLTAILLLLAAFGSLTDALIVSILSLFITNLYLGLGTWTISQMLAFSGIVLFFHWMNQLPIVAKHVTIQAILSFICGLIYGLIVSRIETFIYQLPSFWAYYFQGLPFDLAHGIGNFFFYLILFPAFQPFETFPQKNPQHSIKQNPNDTNMHS